MARADAELLAVSVVRGPVPGGGCTANPPPEVPGTNAPGLLIFELQIIIELQSFY
jgi:hypothetical protein